MSSAWFGGFVAEVEVGGGVSRYVAAAHLHQIAVGIQIYPSPEFLVGVVGHIHFQYLWGTHIDRTMVLTLNRIDGKSLDK